MTQEEKNRLEQAIEMTIMYGKPSLSLLMREMKLTYNQAARLIDQMEDAEVITKILPHGERELTQKTKDAKVEKLHALARKMAHQFANVLYLTKDDFFHSDQWQAGMDSLNQYLLALAGPAPTENDNG